MKEGSKAFDLFIVDIHVRFDGDVSSRQACAACGDYNIDVRRGDPLAELGCDLAAFVFDDLAVCEDMAIGFNPPR